MLRAGTFEAEGEIAMPSAHRGVKFKFSLPSGPLIFVMVSFSTSEGLVFESLWLS